MHIEPKIKRLSPSSKMLTSATNMVKTIIIIVEVLENKLLIQTAISNLTSITMFMTHTSSFILSNSNSNSHRHSHCLGNINREIVTIVVPLAAVAQAQAPSRK
jgi:hypothetical protein